MSDRLTQVHSRYHVTLEYKDGDTWVACDTEHDTRIALAKADAEKWLKREQAKDATHTYGVCVFDSMAHVGSPDVWRFINGEWKVERYR